MLGGELADEWYIDFRDFRLTLSEQMLTYNLKNSHLPGDKSFQAYTRRPKRVRERERELAFMPNGLTIDNFKKAISKTRLTPPRRCGDLTHIKQHLASIKKVTSSLSCEVCGKIPLEMCSL